MAGSDAGRTGHPARRGERDGLAFSMWESVETLHAYTYRSDHHTVFKRRFEWFERWDGPSTVMWWQPAGVIPTVDDALTKLRLLAANGPHPDAFTFKQRFPRPD